MPQNIDPDSIIFVLDVSDQAAELIFGHLAITKNHPPPPQANKQNMEKYIMECAHTFTYYYKLRQY